MTINVNNQSQNITENSSVQSLLEQLNIASNGIAIAINNQIVSRNNWNTMCLQIGDDVIIIKATQGG
ncbi:sulfur carrier protein ThiS [Aquimarina pacifica]|uniref:sulfur carrier protein ThiS n=1 Tax=Aquimarina pacifica TaxID=1296415 RepID=UPI0004722115|nr:sulfur carrier protein ThiS [Aquimarina pacifica]